MRCPGLSVPAYHEYYTLFPKPFNYLAHLLVAAQALQVREIDNHYNTATVYASTVVVTKPITTMPQVLNGLNTLLVIKLLRWEKGPHGPVLI